MLEVEETDFVKRLWQRLNPSKWPLSINDFPPGSILVGGAVRDSLLGRFKNRLDLDFVVPSGAIEFANILARNYGGSCVILDETRNIARLVIDEWTIDISSLNGLTLEEDLLRRDFTVNAIALTLETESRIIDPTLGLEHLRDKNLIAISQKNLIDDPLRLLRALRLKAEFDFHIDSQTIDWIKANHFRLLEVAPERIQSEIQKLLSAKWAEVSIPLIREFGLLNLWLELEEGLAKSPENLSNAKIFTNEELTQALFLSRLTSLLSDEGLSYLRFSKYQCKSCKLLRKWKSRNDGCAFKNLTEFERLQLHKDLETSLPAIILNLSNYDQVDWIQRWRNDLDPLFHPASPVDGNYLQLEFGLPPGPKLGKLLDHLCHERAFGRLQNQEQVLRVAKSWLQRNETSL